MEVQDLSFVGSTGGERSKPRLLNLQNLDPIPSYSSRDWACSYSSSGYETAMTPEIVTKSDSAGQFVRWAVFVNKTLFLAIP